MTDTVLRSLNVDDLSAVAQVHIRAFNGRALSELGDEAVRRYYDWQLNGPHQSHCFGIFGDDKLMGFCFGGAFSGATSGFIRKNKWYLISRVLTHPWLIFSSFFRERLIMGINILRRLGRTPPVNIVPDKIPARAHSFGILAIAIDPEYQGMGLGRILMQEAERIARMHGYLRMNLSVDCSNHQAIKFYEKLGWKKVIPPNDSWHGTMIKDLYTSIE